MKKIALNYIFNALRSVLFFIIKIWDSTFGVNNNRLNVLAYHGISESNDFYSINISSFKKQIDKLKGEFNFVSIDEVAETLRGKAIKGSGIALTFDDGYENILSTTAYLKRNKIPAALFVLSDTLNADRDELANNHKFLSIKQIKYLKKQGWTIGCHSATHRDFHKLSKKQLIQEIVDSRKILQKKLGFEIEYLAFPKGNFNKEILKVVEKAGYKVAFTTQPGSVKKGLSKFIIPRTVINKSYKIADFPLMLSETIYFLRNTFAGPISKIYKG